MFATRLSQWIRIYLGIGVIWCLLTNLITTFTRAPSAFLPVTTASGFDKVLVAVQIAGGQVLLWPLQIYQQAIRPVFG